MIVEKFALSDSQLKKIAQAHKNGTDVSLMLNIQKRHPSGVPVKLTESQAKELADGKNHRITISAYNVKHGGFLPFLLPLLGGLAAATTAGKNIYDIVKKSKKGNGLHLYPPGQPHGRGVKKRA